LEQDHSEFILPEATTIDPEAHAAFYQFNEQAGPPIQKISYDYLVIAPGNRLAYDQIEGFSAFGESLTDVFLGNRLRNYLHCDYKRVPIAITSDVFHEGKSAQLPQNMPVAWSACEVPPVEMAFS